MQQSTEQRTATCDMCGHPMEAHQANGACTVMIDEGTGVPIRCGCELDRHAAVDGAGSTTQTES